MFVQTDNLSRQHRRRLPPSADGPAHRLAATHRRPRRRAGRLGGRPPRLAGLARADAEAGLLYAVNAGSDTVSVFAVYGDQLSARQVVPSGGTSRSASPSHGDSSTCSTPAAAARSRATRVGGSLMPNPAWHRPLGLDPTATPRVHPHPRPGRLPPDGSKLIVTTKANGNARRRLRGRPTAPSAQRRSSTDAARRGAVRRRLRPARRPRWSPRPARTPWPRSRINADGTLTPLHTAPPARRRPAGSPRSATRLYLLQRRQRHASPRSASTARSLTALGNTPTAAGTVDSAASPTAGTSTCRPAPTASSTRSASTTDGTLTPIGAVTVPDAVGGEGIVAS